LLQQDQEHQQFYVSDILRELDDEEELKQPAMTQ
jgi:hypothetical protein